MAVYIYFSVTLSTHPTHCFPRKPVLYICVCVCIPALQISSSVPLCIAFFLYSFFSWWFSMRVCSVSPFLNVFILWLPCIWECSVAQSCLPLCNPVECKLPVSSVCGIFSGKNIGVGCYFLLQGIFPTQGLNLCLLLLLHCRRIFYYWATGEALWLPWGCLIYLIN